MNILSTLKRVAGFGHQNIGSTNIDACLVKIKIRKSEFIIMSKFYYRGHTSYRDYFKYVFRQQTKYILEVAKKVNAKSGAGCDGEKIMIQFYFDDHRYLNIPADVFSNKRNLPISFRNSKKWNEDNIRRILKLYPNYIKYENSLISESDILGLLSGE